MTGVQEQIFKRGGAHNGRAIRCGRPQTRPEAGLRQITALRIKVVDDHLQRFTSTRVQRQVKTGYFSHAANADAVIETGNGDLVGFIQNR